MANGSIDDGSILILSGVTIGTTTSFFVPSPSIPTTTAFWTPPRRGLLDNFGPDNQGGTLTVKGNGGWRAAADVLRRTPPIPVRITTLILNLETTFQHYAFSQGYPSDLVVGQCAGLRNLGGIPTNGFADWARPPRPAISIVQADANTSFYTVPEPGSLLLLGAGLMAWAGLLVAVRLERFSASCRPRPQGAAFFFGARWNRPARFIPAVDCRMILTGLPASG